MFFYNNKNTNNNDSVDRLELLNAMNDFETLQMARKDLIGELEAIIQYDDHIHSSNNDIAKQTWRDILSEEMVHVGELLSLIIYLNPKQKEYIDKGMKEFEQRTKSQN